MTGERKIWPYFAQNFDPFFSYQPLSPSWRARFCCSCSAYSFFWQRKTYSISTSIVYCAQHFSHQQPNRVNNNNNDNNIFGWQAPQHQGAIRKLIFFRLWPFPPQHFPRIIQQQKSRPFFAESTLVFLEKSNVRSNHLAGSYFML